MARPKVVRTKEEAAGVDPSLPIQVEVRTDQSVEVPVPPGNGAAAAPPAAAPRDEGEVTSLKAQLEQMKKETEERTAKLNEQIAAAQRREDDMRRQYNSRDQQTQSAMAQAYQAQVDAVDNATAAAQSALDSAKSGLAIAGQTQDWQALAEAQERIAEAKTRLVQLADAKANLTERAQRSERQQNQPPATVDAYIDQMQVSWQQKEWFRRHPDVLSDQRKWANVQWAHYQAMDKGLPPNSPEYFDAVDMAMGYKQPPKSEPEEDDEPPAPQPQMVAAPVSRESVSASTGRPTTTRITLTAAQREAARDAGVDEITYARGLLELERRKQAGLYQNG